MAKEKDLLDGSSPVLSDEEVFRTSFKLAEPTEGGDQSRELYLITYRRVDSNAYEWRRMPESDWPLLATILPTRVVMHPIYTNPHANRYLSPKNGLFQTVIYEHRSEHDLPEDAEEAVLQLESRLPGSIFDQPYFGLGLNKELDAVWRSLSQVKGAEVLLINQSRDLLREREIIVIGEQKLDALRRAFNRMKVKARAVVRQAKADLMYDDVLITLDPNQFRQISRPASALVRVAGLRETKARKRSIRRARVREVREEIADLVSDDPKEAMLLHSEIERATLAVMIEEFKAMLLKQLKEQQWQRFFEKNKLVLSMVFARPVVVSHTQFHAQGPNLAGTGAKIGDFLFKEECGQSLAIVEIKTPKARLVLDTPYRKPNVFGAHSELSGAIAQVLHQQSELRNRWFLHVNDNPELQGRRSDVIKCVVVAGELPTEDSKLRSFEVFRNACKDVDIITFDELLRKLEFLHKHLQPQTLPLPEEDVPF